MKNKFVIFCFTFLFAKLVNAVELPETGEPSNGLADTPVAAQTDYRNDFSEIDSFDTLLNSNLEDCDPQKHNMSNPRTYQNCKVLEWGQALSDLHPHCKRFFISDDGKIGELAALISKMVADDIKTNRENSGFMKMSAQFEKKFEGQPICPGFKDFTPLMKVAFYTWIFELTAYAESTCNENIKPNTAADVPNGPAVGLYQLELKQSLRSWRGGACKTLKDNEILTAKGNTACSFQIMKSFLDKTGSPFGDIDPKTKKIRPFSYWHSHNPMTPEAEEKAIKKYRECAAKNPKVASKVCTLDPRAKFFGRLGKFPLCQKALPGN
jgi:hypothetical protein